MPDLSREVVVAALHMKIELANKRKNLDKIRHMAKVAKEGGAQILVLPSMFNTGPILSEEYRVRIGRRSAVESIPGPSSEYLYRVASDLGMPIIAGPILERVGSKIYMTSFVIEPLRGIVAKIRKVYGSKKISSGSEPTVMDLGLRFGLFIEDDILLPELSLYHVLASIDGIIAFLRLDNEGAKHRIALFVRAMESSVVSIGVGGIVSRGGEVLFEVPTTVIDECGNLVEEARGLEERVVLVRIAKHSKDGLLGSSGRRKILKEIKKLVSVIKSR